MIDGPSRYTGRCFEDSLGARTWQVANQPYWWRSCARLVRCAQLDLHLYGTWDAEVQYRSGFGVVGDQCNTAGLAADGTARQPRTRNVTILPALDRAPAVDELRYIERLDIQRSCTLRVAQGCHVVSRCAACMQEVWSGLP